MENRRGDCYFWRRCRRIEPVLYGTQLVPSKISIRLVSFHLRCTDSKSTSSLDSCARLDRRPLAEFPRLVVVRWLGIGRA